MEILYLKCAPGSRPNRPAGGGEFDQTIEYVSLAPSYVFWLQRSTDVLRLSLRPWIHRSFSF